MNNYNYYFTRLRTMDTRVESDSSSACTPQKSEAEDTHVESDSSRACTPQKSEAEDNDNDKLLDLALHLQNLLQTQVNQLTR